MEQEERLARHMRQAGVRFTHSFIKKRENFIKAHHILYTFIAGVGLIVFWYGIWEGLKLIPYLGHPLVAIVLGGTMVLVCGAYVYQFIGTHADNFRKEFHHVSGELDQVSDEVQDISEELDEVVKDVEEFTGKVDLMAKELGAEEITRIKIEKS